MIKADKSDEADDNMDTELTEKKETQKVFGFHKTNGRDETKDEKFEEYNIKKR